MEEGNLGNDYMDFREHLRKNVLKPSHRILEFGPLIRPMVTRDTHPNVYFADIRSTEDIKKLYTANDYLRLTGLSVDINEVVEIDYVIKDTYKNTFKNVPKFDVVVLSHVIEHMPDIINFFQDIKNVIADNGKLIIIYPDASYCFDHFRNGTSFIDAYEVHNNKESVGKRVFDFVYNVVPENNPTFFWNDKRENTILPQNDFKVAFDACKKASAGTLPDDAHFWPFSNQQFIKFLYDMDRAGMFGFDIEKFFPTTENSLECMIILTPKKRPGIKQAKYKKILDKVSPFIKNMEAREENKAMAKNLDKLNGELVDLKAENKKLNDELHAVYGSKKWRYVDKIARAKNKITGKQ